MAVPISAANDHAKSNPRRRVINRSRRIHHSGLRINNPGLCVNHVRLRGLSIDYRRRRSANRLAAHDRGRRDSLVNNRGGRSRIDHRGPGCQRIDNDASSHNSGQDFACRRPFAIPGRGVLHIRRCEKGQSGYRYKFRFHISNFRSASIDAACFSLFSLPCNSLNFRLNQQNRLNPASR